MSHTKAARQVRLGRSTVYHEPTAITEGEPNGPQRTILQKFSHDPNTLALILDRKIAHVDDLLP